MNRSRTGDLALLCLLSGSGWLLEHFYPRAVPFPLSGFIHFLLIGLIATLWWVATGMPKMPAGKAAGVAFSGAILFALPAIMLGITAGAVSQFTSLTLFCSIPLMTVLMLGAFDWVGLRGLGSRALPTGVLGLGGALLLFPVQFPGEARGWIHFALIAGCCLLVAFAAIEMHRMTQDIPLAPAIALASLGSAALLVACVAAGEPVSVSWRSVAVELVHCLVFDLPVVWLTIWLIREMHPGRLAARFLIVPLITAIEGLAATVGGVTFQAGIGMTLMAACGAMMVVDLEGDEQQDASSLHLR
jgi:hypothetical protein